MGMNRPRGWPRAAAFLFLVALPVPAGAGGDAGGAGDPAVSSVAGWSATAPVPLASSTTRRVSVTNAEGQANGQSDFPSVSGDGRYVAFESLARNLVAGDTNAASDIFVRDRTGGTTRRVSLTNADHQANASSYSPSISANGRYVAFQSSASNLVSGDTNAASDIFVRDRTDGTTRRVSLTNGDHQASEWSGVPSISANGRYVAFESDASNLVSGDTNSAQDTFVRKRW